MEYQSCVSQCKSKQSGKGHWSAELKGLPQCGCNRLNTLVGSSWNSEFYTSLLRVLHQQLHSTSGFGSLGGGSCGGRLPHLLWQRNGAVPKGTLSNWSMLLQFIFTLLEPTNWRTTIQYLVHQEKIPFQRCLVPMRTCASNNLHAIVTGTGTVQIEI